MMSTRSFSPMSVSLKRRSCRVNLRGVEAMQQQVHLAEQIRQRLGSQPNSEPFLQHAAVGHGLDLFGQVVERFDQKGRRCRRRVEHSLAQARIVTADHETHDGARGVELAGIARGIAHLAEHGSLERAQRVQLVAGVKWYAVELVDERSRNR